MCFLRHHVRLGSYSQPEVRNDGSLVDVALEPGTEWRLRDVELKGDACVEDLVYRVSVAAIAFL
jgi:hypothetical protein